MPDLNENPILAEPEVQFKNQIAIVPEEEASFTHFDDYENRAGNHNDDNINHFNQSEIHPAGGNEDYRGDEPSELAGEGELVGFSEQIIGKISDMAPGIPNQDEVLDQLEETPQYMMQPMNYGGIQWVSTTGQGNQA